MKGQNFETINFTIPVSEFNELKPRLKSPKTGFN